MRSESFNGKSVGAVVRMQRRQQFAAAHVEPRNSPRDKVGWGVGGSLRMGGCMLSLCVFLLIRALIFSLGLVLAIFFLNYTLLAELCYTSVLSADRVY